MRRSLLNGEIGRPVAESVTFETQKYCVLFTNSIDDDISSIRKSRQTYLCNERFAVHRT